MSTSNEPLRISDDDLRSPQVEEYLAVQQNLRREMGEIEETPLLFRVVYSSWFYLSLASGLGALVAWMIFEPFVDDNEMQAGQSGAAVLLMFPTVAGCIGLFLGAAEGIMCRNPGRALISAAVGLGIGFAGGLVAIFAAGLIFLVAGVAAGMLSGELQEGQMPNGLGFLALMMGRGAAWAVAAIPAGLGQGIAQRDKKVALNGLLGGVLGGLLGGLFFDPISLVLTTADGQAAASRGVGFALIGLLVGLFVGLVEGWTKTAWLLMRQGPLAGKQFILFRDTTVLGSSPKSEVYLFKDAAIEPRHAVIYNRGGRFEIEDCQTPEGTYVNGIPVTRHWLNSGDQIVMGKTVLEFALKESR
jgi:MFS family permease